MKEVPHPRYEFVFGTCSRQVSDDIGEHLGSDRSVLGAVQVERRHSRDGERRRRFAYRVRVGVRGIELGAVGRQHACDRVGGDVAAE